MIHETVNNGWYGFALLGGEFGVLVPGGVHTHAGFVPALSGGRPLFIAGTAIGGFEFAGQGEHVHGTMIYRDGWSLDPRIPTVNGVIYDRAGELHIWQGGPHQSSQGYRFVTPDNRLVMADETHFRNGLSQWTDVSPNQDGSLLIGQGHAEGGVQVWDGRVRRWLAQGACHKITVDFQDDNLAIAFYTDIHGGTVAHLVWCTADELRALPEVTSDPQPEPEPPPMSVPDRSAEAHAFLSPRLAHKATEEATREHSFEQVNALCLEFRKTDRNWGLLEKTGGDRVRNRAADVLLYKLNRDEAQVVDVVSDAEGHDGNPSTSWQPKDIRPVSQWVEPFGGGDDPDPGDEDPIKHRYEGGDNDTGECDYVYPNGDVCRLPPGDAIHQGVTDPTDPPDNPPPGSVTNEQIMAAVLRLSTHLGVRG